MAVTLNFYFYSPQEKEGVVQMLHNISRTIPAKLIEISYDSLSE